MKTDWSALTQELSHWRRENLPLPLWWRDDDAVVDTLALTRLNALAVDTGLSVHVAVIPDLVEPSLIPMILEHPAFIPVTHGWRHQTHAPEGAKKAEFGHMRAEAATELAQGFTRMSGAFGRALVPLFVPPWNRITSDLMPALSAAGYAGLSTYGPRATVHASAGITQINTHIDPIFWRGDRGLVPCDVLLSAIVNILRDRRSGAADITEPLGLLTHHLVHTHGVWDFAGDLVRVLLDGGAIPADIGGLLQAERSPSI